MELTGIEKRLELLTQVQEKLTKEHWQLEKEILQKEKTEVYRASDQIKIVQNIYDMLMANAENFSTSTWMAILKADNILELLYQAWIKTDDSFWDELEVSVKKTLEREEKRQKIAAGLHALGILVSAAEAIFPNQDKEDR